MSSSLPRLPLFPLPLVLFPGAALPLHVFEPRYRAMLADCRAGDGRFGIVTADGPAPAAGAVGCVAELRDVTVLPDGRANIVVEGAERFAVAGLADADAAYLVAEVEPWADVDGESPVLLGLHESSVREHFARLVRAVRTLADDPAPAPTLPDDAATLAFAIAAMVDFPLDAKRRLLASRSAAARLESLDRLLRGVVATAEVRAAAHTGARRNGHGPQPS